MPRWSAILLALPVLTGILSLSSLATEDEYVSKRQQMVKKIETEARSTSSWIGSEPMKKSVLDAMAKVRRHQFVPKRLRKKAYQNRPLPIGYGQTISQPYIVALMTDLLDVGKDHVVLEVGTGSGYQAAILGELAKQVYTIEIIKELWEQAKKRLKGLGYRNISVHFGDGYYGLKEQAPFDGILVAAAASHIPPPLVQQMKLGGKMVIPVGSPFMTQQLMLVEKKTNGQIVTKQLLPVRFVPLTGGH